MTTSDENVPDALEESSALIPEETPVDAVPEAVTEPVAPAPVAPAPLAPPSAQPIAAVPPAAYAPTPPPVAYAANPTPNTWMNITAFVTAILGWAIVPIVFGHLGIRASNNGKAELKWMGIVGAVLGYLELVFWALIVGGTLSNVN